MEETSILSLPLLDRPINTAMLVPNLDHHGIPWRNWETSEGYGLEDLVDLMNEYQTALVYDGTRGYHVLAHSVCVYFTSNNDPDLVLHEERSRRRSRPQIERIRFHQEPCGDTLDRIKRVIFGNCKLNFRPAGSKPVLTTALWQDWGGLPVWTHQTRYECSVNKEIIEDCERRVDVDREDCFKPHYPELSTTPSLFSWRGIA